MNNIDKFNRHMHKPIEVPITNRDGVKDMFKITPLINTDLIGFMNLCGKFTKYFANAKDFKSKRKALVDVPLEIWDEFFEYIKKSIKPSYPNIPDDALNKFITNNLMQLYPTIIKLNTEIDESKIPPEIIKEIKEGQTNEVK